MDTTCTAITSATFVTCSNLSIGDLTGIQYFDNLQYLTCCYNLLTTLPALPNSLQSLSCAYNQLTSLPVLPNSLTYLHCTNNLLTTLPTLPNSLAAIYCFNNQMTSLPAIPNSLTILDCSYNQLTSLPNLGSLQQLRFDFNQVTSLPTLPNSLVFITCGHNQITTMPALPNNLTQLTCDNNQLTSLPSLPNSLSILYCYSNLISSLPILPNNLSILQCSVNQLSSLPTLPNTLTELYCGLNNISCFPIFPTSLTDTNNFDILLNPFTCLPNYVAGMNVATAAYPLCINGDSINNPFYCEAVNGIIGYTYKDINANCIYDLGDSTFEHISENLYDSGSNLIGQTMSAINGVYDFPEPAGTYTVVVDTLGKPFIIQCANPGDDSTVVLTTGALLQSNVNFNVTCKPGFDVGVQSIVPIGTQRSGIP